MNSSGLEHFSAVVRLTLALVGANPQTIPGRRVCFCSRFLFSPPCLVCRSCLGHHVPGQLGLPCQGSTRASAGSRPVAWESIFRLNDRRRWGVCLLYTIYLCRSAYLSPSPSPSPSPPPSDSPFLVTRQSRSLVRSVHDPQFRSWPLLPMLPWLRCHRSRHDSIRFLHPPDAGSRIRPWPLYRHGTSAFYLFHLSRVYPPHQNETSTTSGLTPPRTPARRRCAGLKLPTSNPNIAFGHPEPRGATTKRTTDWMPSATPILHACSGPGQRRSTTQTCKPWRRDISP